MTDVLRKTALITGASGGLGLEFAKIFARENYDLVLVARSEDKLKKISEELEREYGIKSYVFAKDLTESAAAYDVYKFTEKENINIDVLVNNAGFGDFGEFSKCELAKQTEMIQLNITALVELTHHYLSHMSERGNGKVLNVASVASFQAGPLLSVYYASKAFVLSFSEALSEELKNSGVSVVALCPGPTQTGFEEAAGMGRSALFNNLYNTTAKDVCEYAYKYLMKGKVVVIPGVRNKLAVFASKIMPRSFIRSFVYKLQNKR